MKKIFNLSILLAALTFASSCMQEEDGLNPPEQDCTVTITASQAQTKTALNGGAVMWESGDRIALIFTHDSNSPAVNEFSTSASGASAAFTGKLPIEVYKDGSGYHETVRAVYPSSAVADGAVSFTLPAEQRVRADGTFAEGLNLASSAVSLADIRDDSNASATFYNALSILRFTLADDVTSVTLTGTSPLAGEAPLEFDFNDGGRLAIDADGVWSGSSDSVTLLPADGAECFDGSKEVNLLVWPGAHSSMTVSLNFKEYGEYRKSASTSFVFEPSKYYTLDFNADSETLVKEISNGLERVEDTLADLEERISALETNAEKIKVLLNQIQSVALMTEYLDNEVYAPFAQQMYSKLKMDISLSYVVRPAAAMKLLLDVCAEEGTLSEVFSAKTRSGMNTLNVSEAVLDGDILTVTVVPADWMDPFYDGETEMALALQISDGNTELLSDFANLVPKQGAVLVLPRTEDIPVLKGASFSMPFKYGAADMAKCSITIEPTGFTSAPTVSYSNGNGYLYANFSESADLSGMSVKMTIKEGDYTDTQTLTFADGGEFVVTTSGDVDYIGGEVAVNVTSNSFGSYTMELVGGGGWIYETYTGAGGLYTVDENTGAARSASVSFNIRNGSLSYTKSVTVNQKATGTPLAGNYFGDGEVIQINQKTANVANALNFVILGDGYQQKDLLKGGKFERAARSACDAFFGVEPFSSFRDRFNVFAVAYKSNETGIDNNTTGVKVDTYFDAWWNGSSPAAWVSDAGRDKVISVVKNTLGLDTDAEYYRTIVLVLSNIDAVAGSCGYPYRDTYGSRSVVGEDYASFAIAVLPANSTSTNGLIRHEMGGHGFGRLGDEYENHTYGSDLATWHTKGFYRNVTTDQSEWNWNNFIGLTGYGDVGYIWRNNYWCPSTGGIMYNNSGVFNAPSRQIIYERIIRQTEGYNAYSWSKFLEYDKKNTTGGAF